MARQDIRTAVNDRTGSEYQIGGSSGDAGQNPLSPADSANPLPANVVGKQTVIVTQFQKLVTPAQGQL
jgi:hypothetical protein